MNSIEYCGVDFSQWCLAEVVEPCGHAIEPRSAAVPGRAGAVLLGGEVPPKVLRVRLYWDATDWDATSRAAVRHEVYAALLNRDGGELVVPSDPVKTYRDAVCTGCGGWSSLFADGSAEVEFTCFDPIAYGGYGVSPNEVLLVGGTWPTWPVVTLVAAAGPAVKVIDSSSGKFVLVEKAFGGGESVVLDFARETCLVDGVDASGCIALGSDFFSIGPGDVTLAFEGCSTHTVAYRERWV